MQSSFTLKLMTGEKIEIKGISLRAFQDNLEKNGISNYTIRDGSIIIFQNGLSYQSLLEQKIIQ